MGKPKPQSFAERGLARTLAAHLSEPLREKILAAVGGARPLVLSAAAARTVRGVGEIYERRGFLSPSAEELSEPTDLTLEYADQKQSVGHGEGSWESAAFIVPTSAGSWRIVVRRQGQRPSIDAAYPIVAGDCIRPAPPGAGAKELAALHVPEGGAEWTRLQELGKELLACHAELKVFLQRKCHRALQTAVWKACQRLQWLCREDLPQLWAALEWTDGEAWQPWACRALKQVTAASDVEECCVPVQSLHFTHDSISQIYRHGPEAGSDLEALVEDLRKGRADPLTCDSLILEVVRYQGRLYSLNNRRLWALQQHQLLLTAEGAEVVSRIRVLPWTSSATLKRFSRAFDTDVDGQAVRCRTAWDGAPTDGVVATTLARAVLATPKAKEAEVHRQSTMLERQRRGEGPAADIAGASARVAGKDDCTEARDELRLGGETFPGWRDAKERVQKIMQLRSGGRPVPENELRLLLDVFRFHPDAARKRIQEVTSVTVGSSEKYKNTPAFWLWRGDGTGEDISVVKCWNRLDLVEKARKKRDSKRDPVMPGERFCGSLLTWHFEKGKSYGLVAAAAEVRDADGELLMHAGQKVYLSWDDISLQSPRASAPEWPFPKHTALSFKVFRWKENGKLGCEDAKMAD